jgi:chromosomal replication initiation ATPase DnaA
VLLTDDLLFFEDSKTRIALLRKKVKTDGINAPDPQVLPLIAGRVSTNIRELEDAQTHVSLRRRESCSA